MAFKRILIISFLHLFVTLISATNLSPIEFGLLEAKTGIERYKALSATHEFAIAIKAGVSYEGISEIDIEIPMDAVPIPLGHFTNFADVIINVHNEVGNRCLFSMDNKLENIDITKSQLSKMRFRKIKDLGKGLHLLVIEDRFPWVNQRRGYQFGVKRRDLLLVKNGRPVNKLIHPYSDSLSDPSMQYVKVSEDEIIIENLTMNRTTLSTYKTYFCQVKNQNNIHFKNIRINTPASSALTGDVIIGIQNCSNVTLEDVTINGTYSKRDKYGYGISMDNVWNSRFIRLKASGEWGVFGNNNINYTVLDKCDINRFDIHCYGRDVFAYNTVFRDLYNQFSSFFGTLSYINCSFINFVPILFEDSYSAYTFFNVEMKGCSIEVDKNRPYLIQAGDPSLLDISARSELRNTAWPNLHIEDVTVDLPENQKDLFLFYVKGNGLSLIKDLSSIRINGMAIKGDDKVPVVKFCNQPIQTEKEIKMSVSRSSFDHLTY